MTLARRISAKLPKKVKSTLRETCGRSGAQNRGYPLDLPLGAIILADPIGGVDPERALGIAKPVKVGDQPPTAEDMSAILDGYNIDITLDPRDEAAPTHTFAHQFGGPQRSRHGGPGAFRRSTLLHADQTRADKAGGSPPPLSILRNESVRKLPITTPSRTFRVSQPSRRGSLKRRDPDDTDSPALSLRTAA